MLFFLSKTLLKYPVAYSHKVESTSDSVFCREDLDLYWNSASY